MDNQTNPTPENRPAPQGVDLAASIREPDLLHEGAVALKLGLTVEGFRKKAKALNLPSVNLKGTPHYRPTAIQAILDKDKQGSGGFFAPQVKADQGKPAPVTPPQPPPPAPAPAPVVKTDAPQPYVAPHLYPSKADLMRDLGLDPVKLDAWIGANRLPIVEYAHDSGTTKSARFDDIKIKAMIKTGEIDFRLFPDEMQRHDSTGRHVRCDKFPNCEACPQ
jgi:hypothetical protein